VDQSGVQRREIVPLRFASAKELSDMLNNLNNEEQKGQNAPQLATKVVADDETNSLVISGPEGASAHPDADLPARSRAEQRGQHPRLLPEIRQRQQSGAGADGDRRAAEG
jgi:type II secretory pathway component GspD/PulD (secretin)